MKNPLNLSENIVSIDIETTGLDKSKDHIVQLSAVKYTNKWKKVAEFDHYICPKEPWEMGKEAFEKHGLTKEFIQENGVDLEDIAEEFIDFIEGCDIISYNGNSFDIPFIYAEFQKIGIDPKIVDHKLIDVFKIETKVNSNKLEDAYRRYTGKEPVNAHNSLADVKMTMRVFYEQLCKYDLEEILESKEMQMDFPEQILAYNENGRIIFTAGKHKDETSFDICKKDPSYIKWLFANVLSQASKDKIMEEYNSLK